MVASSSTSPGTTPLRMGAVPWIDAGHAVTSYTAILLDAYGVLVDASGVIAGATAFIDHLNAQGKPYYILTNDAARLPQSCAEFYQCHGLAIAPERIITAGSLLAPYFAQHGLHGARCVVLGPRDASTYVREAGGVVVAPDERESVDVVVVCATEREMVPQIDAALSMCGRKLEAGGPPPQILLPNPDIIYPKGDGAFGITAGAVAAMLEIALRARFPHAEVRAHPMGKPYAPIFEAAIAAAGTRRVLHIGDQIDTDVEGAWGVGIDCALVATGVARLDDDVRITRAPTYRLRDLRL